ncbi:MAG TPA: lysophospholipid acyltransferase family protein [Polyangiaceae bacterium]
MARGLRHNGAFLRRLAYAGARYGPRLWVEHSPRVFGAAFALALRDKRGIILRNLRRVYGRRAFLAEQRDVLLTFTGYAACLAESLGADRDDAADARIRIEGEAHLRGALAAGQGLILVTAHVGPWDAAARFLARDFSADVMVLMESEADLGARELHDSIRERSGVRVLHVGGDPLDALPVLRHLRAGGVVAFQLDRLSPSGRSLNVQLFGSRAEIPEGPFRLAALAGAPIVPIFAHRAGYFAYEFAVSDPIRLPRRATETELEQAAHRAASAMQGFIARHPTEWFHFPEFDET